jgi:hypothetical protein
LLLQELSSLGGKELKQTPGGIAFSGTWETCYRANLWSRIASRILWRVADFPYKNENDLYAAAKAVDWTKHFSVQKKIRVNVTAQKSPLKSLEFATLKVKDAVCDRFRDQLGSRPDVDRAAPDVRIHVFLEEAKGVLYLDTSGEALFKRGWRMDIADAPLRENLAAGILMLTGWKFDQPLLDPIGGDGAGQGAWRKARVWFRETRKFLLFTMGEDQERKNRPAAGAAPVRQRHRPGGAQGGAPQPRRGGRRALGEARAGRRARARGARAIGSDGGQPPLRRAHRQPRGAGGALSEAGRRAEEKIRWLEVLLLHRRPAHGEVDPAAALAAHAALEWRDRMPPLRIPDRFRE